MTTLTIVALPALWILNRSSDDAGEPAGGEPATDQPTADEPEPIATVDDEHDRLIDDLGRNRSIFMSGDGTRNHSAVVDVELQAAEPGEVNRARASYSSAFAGSGFCVGGPADVGSELTITNVSNNRSISCIVVSPTERVNPEAGTVILDRTTYLSIANAADAPVPVEIRR